MTDICAGQIWERIRDGRRVRVIGVDSTWDDVTYRWESSPSRGGDIYACNFLRNYRLAGDTPEGDTP